MENDDFYRKSGLKSGIEIHQQLNTHKLFCNCPSEIVDDKEKPDLQITRYLRVQAGETGQIDRAAKFEFSKSKKFVYNYYDKSCCLVELDEEPPHEINKEALNIVLQFSKLVNARINDEIQVMRKTVVDGSNTSGFQRTALVAMNGKVNVNNREIKIPTICLEEDAAKIVEHDNDKVIYNLSRLGIPLIEIATEPSMKTPDEVKDVAEYIGLLLRSLKVKRGLGTIRQDVNVSIKGGARVEIKGTQDLRAIPKIVDVEVKRQSVLLKIREDLKERKVKSVETEVRPVTHLFKNTKSRLLSTPLKEGKIIAGIKVRKFAGLLGREIMPNKRLGTELAMHAKLFGLKGLLHSDELPNYGITNDEIIKVREELKCGDKDAFILIAGEESTVMKAVDNIIKRLEYCIVGVPEEVRKAEQDFTTSYLRPMPGASRMYPETDIPIIKAPKNIEIVETVFDKIKRYNKLGLSNDLARITALSSRREFFDYLTGKYRKTSPKVISQLMFLTTKDLKTRLGLDTNGINDSITEKIVRAVNNKIVSEDSAEKILEEFLKGKNIEQAIRDNQTLNEGELRERIKKIINKNNDVKNPKAIIGIVMKEIRGKAEGRTIVRIINELLKNRSK